MYPRFPSTTLFRSPCRGRFGRLRARHGAECRVLGPGCRQLHRERDAEVNRLITDIDKIECAEDGGYDCEQFAIDGRARIVPEPNPAAARSAEPTSELQ